MTQEEEAIKKEMEEEASKKETSETSEDENKEEDANEAEEKSESKKDEDDSLKTDYEAEIEKERSRAEEAERKLAETRRKAKERFEEKKRKEEESGEDEEDRPPTISEFRAILAEDREATRKEFQSQQILEIAKEFASSDAEARLIVEIHKNRSFPSGLSTREQIEESFAIANRKKLLVQNEELKRALRSKETKNRSGSGFHDSSMKSEEPKIGSADIGAIKAAGFEWDAVKRLYKKSIAGGKKHVYFDPKKKTRFVQ